MFKKAERSFILSPALLVFLSLSVIGLALSFDLVSFISDEYSHWALVSKEVLRIDSLPNASTVVKYRDYPPAIALFLYFGMKLTGFSEGFSRAYQIMMQAGALITILAGTSYKKAADLFARMILLFMVFAFLPTTIYTLLADNIVALFSMACFVMIINTQSNDIPSSRNKAEFIIILIAMAATSLVKTSAIAFIVAATVLMILIDLPYCGQLCAPFRIKRLLLIFTSYIPILAWRIYVDLAYPVGGYADNKFSLTLGTLTAGYDSKSAELRHGIKQLLIKTLYTGRIFIFVYVAFVVLILYILYKHVQKESCYSLICLLAVFALTFVFYIIGYYVTLVYMIPAWEYGGVPQMIGLHRYTLPLIVVILTGISFSIVKNADFTHKKTSVFILLALLLLSLRQPYEVFSFDPRKTGSYWQYKRIDEVYREAPVVYDNSTRLLFYTSKYKDNETYFNNFELTGKYLNNNTSNFSHDTLQGQPYDKEALVELIRNNDVLILLFKDAEFYRIIDDCGIRYDNKTSTYYNIEVTGDVIRLMGC